MKHGSLRSIWSSLRLRESYLQETVEGSGNFQLSVSPFEQKFADVRDRAPFSGGSLFEFTPELLADAERNRCLPLAHQLPRRL